MNEQKSEGREVFSTICPDDWMRMFAASPTVTNDVKRQIREAEAKTGLKK